MRVQVKWMLVVVAILFVRGAAGKIAAQDIQPPPFIHSLDWSEDGSHFALATSENLTIYDASLNPVAVHVFPSELSEVPIIDLSPDGSRIFVGSPNLAPEFVIRNRIPKAIWDTTTFLSVLDLDQDDILFFTSQWSSDGRMISFRDSYDRGTNIYSTEDGALLRRFDFGIWRAGTMPIWSPDNRHFATLDSDDFIHLNILVILDALTGQSLARYPIPVTHIDSISWSVDSTHIALVTTTDVALGSPESIPTGESSKAALVAILIVDTET
ncbi:MAG: WD40 repeat domain-containing protein, partial [Anaerolineae bacterium]|nr:WD40 repeat domain-containing protein [Anaerolineae bacterium]